MTAVLAEFKEPPDLLRAVRLTREKGLPIIDAFTPFPVEGLSEAMGLSGQRINWLGFLGMAAGALFGWWMQWYANVDFPLNIGGRPVLAPPAFIVLTFEFAMLGGALFMFIGWLVLDRLPKLHHPVFAAPRFHLASRDRYFLLIEAADEEARQFIDDLRPVSIAEVAL